MDKERRYLLNIPCPYHDRKGEFHITFDPTEAKEIEALPYGKAEEVEVEALPYARDIGPFDPDLPKEIDELRGKDPDELRGKWSQVGKDFYPGLSYERIGILHWEQAQKIYYCVARCTQCHELLDVFVNFTKGKTLSKIWPHLLGESDEDPEDPHLLSRLFKKSRLFDNDLFRTNLFLHDLVVLAFLILIYLVSIVPSMILYFQESVFLFNLFLEDNYATLLLRGIVIFALFLLLALRRRNIQLFRDEKSLRKFSDLFKIRRKERSKLITYWLRFAVCRFVGYQKKGRLISWTQVMIIGGLSSSIILFITWLLARAGILETDSPQNSYAMFAELAFWLIVSYGYGIVGWNVSAVPIYILEGMRKVPMNLDPRLWQFDNLKIIELIGLYSGLNISILIFAIWLLGALPVFIPGFEEPLWVIVWAQFTLIFFYCVIKKFSLPSNKIRRDAVIQTILIILVYVLFRVGIGTAQTDGLIIQAVRSLGIIPSTLIKPSIEFLAFVVPSLTLLWLLFRAMNGKFKEIKKEHKDRALRELRAKSEKEQNEIEEIEEIMDEIKEAEATSDKDERDKGRRLKVYNKQIGEKENRVIELSGRIESVYKQPLDSPYFKRAIALVISLLTALILPTLINLAT